MHQPQSPYLYTDAEVQALLAACRRLQTRGVRLTAYTLFGLLAATGLRVGEAIALDRTDVDARQACLIVRHGKFNKSREVPLHPTTMAALRTYAQHLDAAHPRPRSPSFFLTIHGTRPHVQNVWQTFDRLRAWRVSRESRARGAFTIAAPLRDGHRAPLVSPTPRYPRATAAALHVPGTRRTVEHLLVSHRHAGAPGAGGPTGRAMARNAPMTALAPLLQAFFSDRLLRQRRASAHTVMAYRDTFRLLLGFAQQRLGRSPTDLRVADLDASLIVDFLHHLETGRHNTLRTRNARLAALRSFFRFAALHLPDHLQQIQRILAIPQKKPDRRLVGFLTRPEIEALLAIPDRTTWIGRRDATLLVVALHTGLRVSELIGLHAADVVLTAGAHVRCIGKGRKERCTPLTGAIGTLRDRPRSGSQHPAITSSRAVGAGRSVATQSNGWSTNTWRPLAPPVPRCEAST